MSRESEKQPSQRAADFVSNLYSGMMTPENEQALEGWLAADSQHRTEYQKALEIWSCMSELADDEEVLAYADATPADLHPMPRNAGLSASGSFYYDWPVKTLAAGFLFVIFLAGVLIFNDSQVQPPMLLERYVTAVGEQKSITLQDGTVLTLNTNTQVLIDYSDKERRAILDRGEALFSVSSDSSRPFTVDIGVRTITVLGTEFNVRKLGLRFTVAVAEGLVAVHRKEEGLLVTKMTHDDVSTSKKVAEKNDLYHLAAGTIASFAGNGELDRVIKGKAGKELEEFYSWQRGFISFDEQPLFEVVREINRYVDKKILIEDDRIMNLKVSGVFYLGKVDDLLDGLKKVFPLGVTKYTDRVVIVRKDNEFR